MITVEKKAQFERIRRQKPREQPRSGRVPRVARLMALAIRFDQLIRDGVVADKAALARLGRVTRARLTQVMNLLHLAPDLQAELLFLPTVTHGRDQLSERELRRIEAQPDWGKQREMWRNRRIVKHETVPR